MTTVTLNIPGVLDMKTFNLSIYVASKMYEDGILSAGHAASVAGLSKRAFIEIMGHYGVSAFSTSIEDLENDMANA
jgi:predicted HTH domain antitoxin